ncbi:Hypothetical protein Nlim_0523 [Candidatus Nitrosarchaeum limnium SFB1]|jgi:hypothetical protein|uniref:Uncharacterized protein n=1 Tax=Candidatus Nitrosarchaeum limnium SFB1 TaxID=886738 RepID=F3KJ67_9ARCH|nr:Hypothetical protein Nlim_0523 [Candidatus Nitrosarchaeum limnium SFB1]
MIVVAAFIITAVFVGYHASQESQEKMSEGHSVPSLVSSLSNHAKQTASSLFIITHSFQI